MVFHKIRHFLGLKPPYYEARKKLYEAVRSGVISKDDPMEQSDAAVEKICGWDSWTEGADWVELKMEAEALSMEVKTVGDFIRLLEGIDSRYET